MSKIFRPYQQDGIQSYGYHWWCPGCEGHHGVPVKGSKAWGFNGDEEKPTLTPSVLVTSGHFAGPGDCWCTYEERFGKPAPFKCDRCHCFIRNGMIEFLSDCSHALAGKTVPIPELP